MRTKYCISLSLVFFLILGLTNFSRGNESKKILLLIDNSGSMKQNDPGFLIKDVVINFVDSLDKVTELGIYLFDESAKQIIPLTLLNSNENKNKSKASLDFIDYKGALTNIPDVMEKAVYELKQQADSDAFKSIIFITDGFIDTGDKNKDSNSQKWLLESLASDANKNNIKIFGIAFTENADFQLIQGITTKTDGEYFRIYNANEIEGVFNKITASIENTKKTQTLPLNNTQEPHQNKQGWASNKYLIVGFGIIIILFVMITFRTRGEPLQKENFDTAGKNNQHFIPEARLVDLDKITSEDEILITEEVTSIGRNEENNICLKNAENTVTGLSHAQIIFQDNSFYIKDLSTNYTKLNNVKLQKKELVKLKNDDVISIMKYRFQFLLPESLGQTVISTDTVISGAATIIEPSEKEKSARADSQVDDIDNHLKIENESSTEEQNNVEVKSQDNNQKDEEPETLIKPSGCPNHPDKEPTGVCEVCCKAFCSECLIEDGDKIICTSCVKK